MLEAVLAVGALLATLLIGIPLLSAVGRQQRRFRRFRPVDQVVLPSLVDAPPAFTPLEMEPFRLSWPSETARERTSIPEPPWPSETWDDEYFGAEARKDLSRMKETVAAIEENSRRVSLENAASLRRADRQERRERAEGSWSEPPQPLSEPPRAEPTPPAPPEPTPAAGPSPQEVAQMVQDLGLAGAVEEIRDRTGWDFKAAAQYLASTLRR